MDTVAPEPPLFNTFSEWKAVETASERGGESSNTPPSNSQRVTGSEDTGSITLGVNWGEGFDNLMASLELRKKEAQESEELSCFESGGLQFLVSPSGFSAGGYVAYQLAANGVRFGIANTRSPYGETPNVYLSIGSAVLMFNDGLEPVWWYCQKVIAALGGELLWNKISRVDPCVDLWNVEVRELHDEYRQGCVTRAKHKVTYEYGLHLSGFVLGRGAAQLRVYDKRLESEKDPTKWDILQRRRMPNESDGQVCTRVEFQCRREFLKSFGIDTVDDWIAHRAAVCEYLVTEWARICEAIRDRTHTSRGKLTQNWERVREAFAAWTGGGLAGVRTFKDVQYNGEALFRMALGCVGRIIASRAEGEMYSMKGFMARVYQVFTDGLSERDLISLQERFILRYHATDPYIGEELDPSWEFEANRFLTKSNFELDEQFLLV